MLNLLFYYCRGSFKDPALPKSLQEDQESHNLLAGTPLCQVARETPAAPWAKALWQGTVSGDSEEVLSLLGKELHQ